MKNSEVALSDCKKVQNNFFRLHMNEIGVICLNDIEYQIFLGSFNRDKKIVEYIKKVSHKKEEKYYLRGRYYYYWLPSYITGSLESKYAGWKKIVIDGIDIIEHIARYNIKENKYACILSYVICDHLLSVLYLAMYCAEEDVLDRERNVISSYRHIENSVCILNKILFSVFDNKIEYSNLDSLVKELKSISFEDMDIIRENEKFLLELDNYNTIYEAVYNIIDNLKVKAQKIDKVIYFAYGGISLGYAFKTIMKELFDKNVELLPSHYSSKRNNTESGIIDRIPRFKCGENGWMDESNCILDTIGENNRKEEFDNTNEYLIKMNLEADCLKVQFISDASTKELKMMIERLAPVEVGLMVKTWGNGGFLEVDFKESQAIISNK